MGDIDGAGQSFEKALSITDNATVTNNFAATKHRQSGKSSDEIKSYFENANTTESKYNLGLINIEEGKYEEAITLMGESKSFSLALANVLFEKYDIANDILDQLSPDDASVNYLRSIIASRLDNIDLMIESLKSAFSIDPNLKNKAKSDREFIKHFENADFLAIF